MRDLECGLRPVGAYAPEGSRNAECGSGKAHRAWGIGRLEEGIGVL
jgi:hypothetical protein